MQANSKALESFAVGMEITFMSKKRHEDSMKLPSSVPESKSMERLVVLADSTSGTAKVGSL